MAATKVEIKLRKGEPQNWSMLFVNKEIKDTVKDAENEDKENLCDEIESVDLSDI